MEILIQGLDEIAVEPRRAHSFVDRSEQRQDLLNEIE
jgi:hypothetical protein